MVLEQSQAGRKSKFKVAHYPTGEKGAETIAQRTQDDQIKAIVEATLHTQPEDATHWSSRTLAKRFGVSHMTVARIWDC
ncbi:MAG: hypothetical protein KGJ88_13550, partial [Verrucomicrobiota bacterium]|nr:hypothetical protein [Verrucomicrobiota bacterium]